MVENNWDKLKNKIGPWNEFSIVRGKEYIKFGKDVWVGYFCLVDGSGGLEIGNKVTLSSGVHVYTHDSSKFRAYDWEKDPKKGSHIRMAPVKIGNNVIIGALTLVNKDIPDNSFVTGNPMVIKNLKNDNI